MTMWLLSRENSPQGGVTVAKMRFEREQPLDDLRVHPGREWFTVLSGTVRLVLGDRTIIVPAGGDAAEFSTMIPHAICADGGPAEVLSIMDHAGERAHMPSATTIPDDAQL